MKVIQEIFKKIMLNKILAISGKPGLYKLTSSMKNNLIVESLANKKRMPVFGNDKIISLDEVFIFADNGKVSVGEVFTRIHEKEDGKTVSIDYAKASPDELLSYFAEVLPDYDRKRVYPTDVRKLLKWYDLLIENGITDFLGKEEEK